MLRFVAGYCYNIVIYICFYGFEYGLCFVLWLCLYLSLEVLDGFADRISRFFGFVMEWISRDRLLHSWIILLYYYCFILII